MAMSIIRSNTLSAVVFFPDRRPTGEVSPGFTSSSFQPKQADVVKKIFFIFVYFIFVDCLSGNITSII